MHPILTRQLKRLGLVESRPPENPEAWSQLLAFVGHAYEQADQDRYLLERSLALSSDEMAGLHARLAAERDWITAVICSLGEGVCAMDENGSILFMNPKARQILQIPEGEDLDGWTVSELADVRTEDGKDLGTLLRERVEIRMEDERRVIIGGDENTFIVCGMTSLDQQRSGVVLTLRDVTQRRRMEHEQQELSRQLVEVSRQAGMAEVASDVLHNVGNVLNSVNVSASLATESVKSSRCAGVRRVGSLLSEHKDRLAEYLLTDPAGSKVIDYLLQLGEQLEQERTSVLAELDNVRRSIEHIREIVTTQQSLARVKGVREFEQVETLIEEALRVLEPSLARHGVSVVREFSPTPPVLVARSQLLQIFINLIKNAKQAVSGLDDQRRRITIRIKPENQWIVVAVEDHGCGIEPQNLTRIFSHGFTTKQGGHGFGLHSAALAARVMGGTLDASSDGIDRGAIFTLRVPIADAGNARAA